MTYNLSKWVNIGWRHKFFCIPIIIYKTVEIMSEKKKKIDRGSLFGDYVTQKYCRFIIQLLVTEIVHYKEYFSVVITTAGGEYRMGKLWMNALSAVKRFNFPHQQLHCCGRLIEKAPQCTLYKNRVYYIIGFKKKKKNMIKEYRSTNISTVASGDSH